MPLDNKYSIDMIWSGGDGVYLAQVKELPGCVADGETPEDALRNLAVIVEEWIETAKEEGRQIPPPLTLEVVETQARAAHEAFHQQIQTQIQGAVQDAVQQVFEIFQAAEQERTQPLPTFRESGISRFSLCEKQKV